MTEPTTFNSTDRPLFAFTSSAAQIPRPDLQSLVTRATYYRSDPSLEIGMCLITALNDLCPRPHFMSQKHLRAALSCLAHPSPHNIEAALRCLYSAESFGKDTRKLGEGTSAAVWQREFTPSPDLDALMGPIHSTHCVAAKEFHSNLAENGAPPRELARELEMLEKCEKMPDVRHLAFYTTETPNTLYLDWAEKGPLMGIQSFSAEECAQIIRTIAQGINELHESGIIHRDIKPANILLTTGNHPLIGDLGSAIDKKEFLVQTESPGSPAFFSPELARALIPSFKDGTLMRASIPENQLEKIDVWAFGMLIFELFKQKGAFLYSFGHAETHSFLYQLSKYNLPFSEELYTRVLDPVLCQEKDPNGNIIRIMKRCLTINPKDRPSMQEIIEMYTQTTSKVD